MSKKVQKKISWSLPLGIRGTCKRDAENIYKPWDAIGFSMDTDGPQMKME